MCASRCRWARAKRTLIFEYLNLLVSRPEVARALGERAGTTSRQMQLGGGGAAIRGLFGICQRRTDDQPEKPMPEVGHALACQPAGRPGLFDSVGVDWQPLQPSDAATPEKSPQAAETRQAEEIQQPADAAQAGGLAPYLHGWAHDEEQRGYLNTHETRLVKTLSITPPGGPGDRILEMGAYLQITPALQANWAMAKSAAATTANCRTRRPSHRHVHPMARPSRATSNISTPKRIASPTRGRIFQHGALRRTDRTPVRRSDASDERGESHPETRRPFCVTTPNVAALRGIAAILLGYHPGFFHAVHQASRDRAKSMRGTIANIRRARSISCWKTPASR